MSQQNRYDVCVVGGAGHVGLPLSLVFALKGCRVLIHDISRSSLERIGRGEMPFMERGAEPILKDLLARDMLGMSADPAGIAGIPVVVITIGTPIDEFLNPTLRVIRQCIDELLPYISDEQLIVLRSTVYPGVTEWVGRYLEGKGRRAKVAFCPERIVQGYAIEELQTLPQIVSGNSSDAEDAAAELFALIAPDVVRLAPIEAEFAKLFSNAYRYCQFAISNQFYMMATSAGVDFYRVLDGMKKEYPRLGDMPSAGFAAGPCLFKDTMQLTAFNDNQFSIGSAAMLINEGLPLFIIDTILKPYDLRDLTVGLLGMAFKANSDDPRASLSYKLKRILAFRAKAVLTTDPFLTTDADLRPIDTVVESSDVIILCAPHSVYKDLDLTGKIVVDVWNFWKRSAAGMPAMAASSQWNGSALV